MLKKDLVKAVSDKTGLKLKESREALEALLEIVTSALSKGDYVLLTGFGKFEVRDRAARAGINPQTLEKIQLPATKVAAFKAGKALKEAVK